MGCDCIKEKEQTNTEPEEAKNIIFSKHKFFQLLIYKK